MNHTPGAPRNGFVVLLAEAQEHDINLIRRSLKRLGAVDRLMVVSDGEQTVSYLLGDGKYRDRRSFPFPEIIFLDYQMPLLSGLGVLCWLRSEPRFQHLPVVPFSDAYSVAQTETISRLRAGSCLKPCSPEAIVEAMTQSVRRALDTLFDAAPFYRHEITPPAQRPGTVPVNTDQLAAARL